MYELLEIGDQHLDSVAPSSRKDDYTESMKAKFLEIREIAISRKVLGVIWKGDLIHKQDGHRVPYSIVNWLIKYFNSYPDEISNLLALGNHDIKSVAANWWRQPIGAVVESGAVKPLWDNPSQDNPLGARTHVLQPGICVHGKLFDYEADTEGKRRFHYAVPRQGSNDFWIMACHTALLPDGETFFGHYITVTDLAKVLPREEAADLYVCGHIHDDMGEYCSYHIRALNLGALARGTIDEFNIQRDVKIGSIKLAHDGNGWKCDISAIKLKSPKPAADVFYIKEIEQKKHRVAELEQLAEMLKIGNIADEFSLVNPDQALEVVLKSRQVSSPVEKKVREFVNAARQELG